VLGVDICVADTGLPVLPGPHPETRRTIYLGFIPTKTARSVQTYLNGTREENKQQAVLERWSG